MGEIVFGYASTECVALWTEADSDGDPRTARNLVVTDNACVAVHDDVSQSRLVSGLIKGKTHPPKTLALGLAKNLRSKLKRRRKKPQFGVITGGFEDGRPMLVGIHSGRDFSEQLFYPQVDSARLPKSIFKYLAESLDTNLRRPIDVVDFLVLVGLFYFETITPLPAGMSLALVERGAPARLLSESEIGLSRERGFTRLTRFQSSVIEILTRELG